jgi:hypothetical protein
LQMILVSYPRNSMLLAAGQSAVFQGARDEPGELR